VSKTALLAAAALALTSVAGVAVARAGADPCAVSWTDPAGDTTYGLGVAVPLADDDLDATKVTVRANATSVVETVTVKHLDPAGPAYGTGHGIALYLTDHGTAVTFAARIDKTYGDKRSHTGVRLSVDPKASTFTLTVPRADLAKIAGSPTGGGTLSGVGGFTLRSDHTGGVADKAAPGASVGTNADGTSAGGDGATLSLDACDAHLRRLPPPVPQRTSATVTDGFTISGPAGSQAVIRLARETGPPGQFQHGPPVTLTASKGAFAGLAIVGVGNGWYDTVVRTLGKETYDTDSDTNVPYDRRLPAGSYVVALLGEPGATVTATVAASSARVKPVRVQVTALAVPQATPTTDLGTGQRAQGSWTRLQFHRKVLLGVIHVASAQYGNTVSYNLSVPDHSKVGQAALTSDAPGPVPLGLAWTPVSTTHIAFGVSDAIETDVTAAWSGEVDAVTATQKGIAVYLALVAK
jgi:hypothetical protein